MDIQPQITWFEQCDCHDQDTADLDIEQKWALLGNSDTPIQQLFDQLIVYHTHRDYKYASVGHSVYITGQIIEILKLLITNDIVDIHEEVEVYESATYGRQSNYSHDLQLMNRILIQRVFTSKT